VISLVLDSTTGSESFSISPQSSTIIIKGGDERGLIYGSLSIAEDLRNGIALKNIRAKKEKPYLPFRAIKFDLPWDTYRHSYALDLHSATCKDTSYWKAFLDMMVENRFNTLSLWNLHPYPYLINRKIFRKQVLSLIRKWKSGKHYFILYSGWQMNVPSRHTSFHLIYCYTRICKGT